MAIIGESNTKHNHEAIKRVFSKYHMKDKFMKNAYKARFTVLLNKNVNYECDHELENNDTSSMCICIKTSKRKYSNVDGSYGKKSLF